MALQPEEADDLLAELCTRLGFCLPSDEHERLRNDPPDEVIAFVDAVFVAEGMNPGTADRRVYRQVRDCVSAAFKRAQVAAEPAKGRDA